MLSKIATNYQSTKEVIKEYQEDLTYKFKVLEKTSKQDFAVIKNYETEEN